MPKGPQGQKRPADVIGGAIMVAKIATGEIPDGPPMMIMKKKKNKRAKQARVTRRQTIPGKRI